MLTILTWLWQQPGGRTRYTDEHVRIWAAMVRRNLSMPHRLAVVTDLPGDYGDVEVIPPPRDFEDVRIPSWSEHMPQCLRRLAMFRPDAGLIFGERFVAMDLDCVISGPLDPLFDRPEDFVMYRGTHAVRPYNGSMLMMTAGARPQVYEQFTPQGAALAGKQYIGSDQAWISHVLGAGEATWDAGDGVHAYGSRWNEGDPRIMFFLGPKKPWDLTGTSDWVAEHYHIDHPGRCLILGYAPTVWDEAYVADGPFDAVIASPEASAHRNAPGWEWGDVTAIANNDAEAMRLARSMGFAPENIVFCGRQAERSAA